MTRNYFISLLLLIISSALMSMEETDPIQEMAQLDISPARASQEYDINKQQLRDDFAQLCSLAFYTGWQQFSKQLDHFKALAQAIFDQKLVRKIDTLRKRQNRTIILPQQANSLQRKYDQLPKLDPKNT